MSQPSLRRCQRRNTALAFALSLGLVAAAYALLGFVPFGDGTLLTGDLNGLYVNYITDLWRRVRQGGFFYSFSKLCGGSTLGLFAYYMNSPFNLLYLLFPVRAIPWVVQGVFALRTACTGAACCFYLQRHFHRRGVLLLPAAPFRQRKPPAAGAQPGLQPVRVLRGVQPEHHLDGRCAAGAAGAVGGG